MLKKYNRDMLDDVVATAKKSDRLRTNLNIHETTDASVQRLFLAFEPGTYIRPHKHPQEHKWELFIVLQGELELLIFNDAGEITERTTLSPAATRVVEIPANTWHSYISKQNGTLALEIKDGAYIPATEEDFLPTSPKEHSSEAGDYLQWMKTAG